MAGQQKLDSLVDAGAAAAPAKPGRFAPAKHGAGKGMNSREMTRAAIAGTVLLISGGLLAWHFGVFDASPKALPAAPVAPANVAPLAPEEKQAVEEQQKETEEQIKAGEAEQSGSG